MIDGYPMNIKGYLQKVIIQSFLFCSLSRYIKRWTSINIRPHFAIVQCNLNDPASSNTQKFRLFGRTNLVHGIYGLKEKFWNLNFRQVEILFKVIWRFELLWVKSRGFRGQMYKREKKLYRKPYTGSSFRMFSDGTERGYSSFRFFMIGAEITTEHRKQTAIGQIIVVWYHWIGV